MSQHDMDYANAAGSTFRADLNLALKALASTSQGGSAPGTTFAAQLWADSAKGVMYQRNVDNDAWNAQGLLAGPAHVATNTGNAYDITPDPAIAAYADIAGLPIMVQASAANTGAATLSISGLADIDIKKWHNSALVDVEKQDLLEDYWYFVVYTADAGDFVVLNPSSLTSAMVGDIKMFADDAAPAGWLECDGAAYSRTKYSRLFDLVGTTWGSGDGSTTFNVPDLRGEFPRGWDHGRGVDAGLAFASAQADELEAHTHTYGANQNQGYTGGNVIMATSGSGYTTGSTGGTETRPRNIAVLFRIKY